VPAVVPSSPGRRRGVSIGRERPPVSEHRAARAHLQVALDSLASLLAVIDEVGSNVSAASPVVRQQIHYLWIVVGSRSKEHARVLGRTRSASGFANAIRPETSWRSAPRAPSLTRSCGTPRRPTDHGLPSSRASRQVVPSPSSPGCGLWRSRHRPSGPRSTLSASTSFASRCSRGTEPVSRTRRCA